MTDIFTKGAFRQTIRRILVLPVALLLLSLAAVLALAWRTSTNVRWERHSLEVVSSVRALDKLLVDLETGIRGFQITGDRAFLEPYQRAWPEIAPALADLDGLVADNPEQRQRMEVIRRDIELWDGFAREVQARMAAAGAAAASFNRDGKARMDRLRTDISAFSAAEQELLRQRSAVVAPAARSTLITAAGLAVIFVVVLALWTRRHVHSLVQAYERTVDDIHEQKEWFRITLASIGDAVIVTDPSNRVVLMNAEAERLTGWTSAEAVTRPLRSVFRIVNERTRHPADDPVDRVIREGRVVGLANHTVLISRQAAEWPIEDSAAPIFDARRQLVGVVLVFRDASEQRRNEDAIKRARDEALHASRAKDDFLAALSHELRTPLNPALLLASEGAGNPTLSAEVRGDFEAIARNIRFEARLIDDLLDLTRITRGKLSLKLESIDLTAFLVEVLATVREELTEKNITFSSRFDLPTTHVEGDPARLQQVFLNLLRNAIKFTPSGGTISLSAHANADTVQIAVADSGIGLSAGEIERVFQPFTQGDHADDPEMRRFGGLGLGLTIARMLVGMHRGSIDAASPGRGRGATFTVTLPLAPASTAIIAPAVDAPRPAAASSIPAIRVLVVEDHEATRTALVRLLQSRHYAVREAGTVADALMIAASDRFAFVISDIGLPDGDGYGLMTELERLYGLHGIALTGYGMATDIERAKAAGFVAHLTKPVDVGTLDAALHSMRPAVG